MNEQLEKISELNTELAELIRKKCRLARNYYQKEYPMLSEGNIIFDGYRYILLKTSHVSFDSYSHRQRLVYGEQHYRYDDRPKNQIEKEFSCDCTYTELIKSGLSKKRGWGLRSDYIDHEQYKLVCNVNDFKSLAKKYNIYNKLNSVTIKLLHDKLK